MKSWKEERKRRKGMLTQKRLHSMIVKDLEECVAQHLRSIISGQSAQQIAEITQRIQESKKQPVILAECEDYYRPLNRIIGKENESKPYKPTAK